MGDRFTEQLDKFKQGRGNFLRLCQKFFYHPMLWASLGAHALFMLIPMGGSSTPNQADTNKDPEPVKLTTIAGSPTTQKKPIPRARPKPPAAAIAKPKAAPPRRKRVVAQKPPALVTKPNKPTRPTPKPTPEAKPTPTETPTPESKKTPVNQPIDNNTTPTPESSTSPQAGTNLAPTIGGDASGAQLPPEFVPFVDALTESSGVTDVDGNYLTNVEAVMPQPDEFTEGGSDPQAFFGADLKSGVPGLVPGGFLVVGKTPPDTFKQEMTSYFSQQGYSLNPVGSYGGGEVFQATIDGTTAYISTVRLKPVIGKEYTGVVLWKQLPPGL